DLVSELPDTPTGSLTSPFRATPLGGGDLDHATEDAPSPRRRRPAGRGRPSGVDTAAHLTLPPLPDVGSLIPPSTTPVSPSPVPPIAPPPAAPPNSPVSPLPPAPPLPGIKP